MKTVLKDADVYTKAVVLHDALALDAYYLIEKDSSGQNINNSYKFLVNKYGLCENYSRVYAYLLGQLGIKSEIVTSDQMVHEWMKICVDEGENGSDPLYLNVDLTWDDPVPDQIGHVGHTYFLLSDSLIQDTSVFTNGNHHYDYTSEYTYPVENGRAADMLADNWKFHSYDTRMCIIGNDTSNLYAVNPDSCSIVSYNFADDSERVIYTLPSAQSHWSAGGNQYYVKPFTSLEVFENKLYYSTPNEVYSFDPNSSPITTTKIDVTPVSGKQLFGMVLEGNKLYGCWKSDYNSDDAEKVLITELQHTVHSYSEPVWTWSNDLSSASATFSCSCGDEQIVNAAITIEVRNDVPYRIATVEFEGQTYTDAVAAPEITYYEFSDNDATLTLYSGTFDKNSIDFGDTQPGLADGTKRQAVQDIVCKSGISFTGDCTGMFSNLTSLESFNNDGNAIDTSAVTIMNKMFSNCSSIASFNLSGFTTGNVTDFSEMFAGCSELSAIDMTGFTIAETSSYSKMFEDCGNIDNIILGADSSLKSGMELINGNTDNDGHYYGYYLDGEDEKVSVTGGYSQQFAEFSPTGSSAELRRISHIHDFGNPVWHWNEDNTEAYAEIYCNDCGHKETVQAEVSSEQIDPTCTQDGKYIYTAAAVFNNEPITDIIEKPSGVPATPHSYNTVTQWIWGEDHTTAQAVVACGSCTSTDTVNAEVNSETKMIDGKKAIVYTASVSLNGYDYTDEYTVYTIDWDNAVIAFTDGSEGFYSKSSEAAVPQFSVSENGTALSENTDYVVAANSTLSSSAVGLHTITLVDVNDETNTKTFSWYIYRLDLECTPVELTENRIQFNAIRSADTENVSEFGIVFDRIGRYNNNLSRENCTNAVSTNIAATSAYSVKAVDAGGGIYARPYMIVALNGEDHVVYGIISYCRRFNPEDISNPVIEDYIPQIIDGKLRIKTIKPAYDTSSYSCEEMGVLFNKTGTVTSVDDAKDKLLKENINNTDIRRAYVDSQKLNGGSLDDYATYSANIRFENGEPIYTRSYVVLKDSQDHELIVYGNCFVTQQTA